MRDQDVNTNVFELPQTPGSASLAPSGHGDNIQTPKPGDTLLFHDRLEATNPDSERETLRSQRRWPRAYLFRDKNELIYFVAVILTTIPIVLLAVFAPSLSSKLGSQACLPNGEFVLPGTASIWNPAYFFTISITAQGANSDWTYTHVKILDVVWDVAVGRGGQLVLIFVSYRVFSRSLAYVMETRRVDYQTYSAVSFNTTGLRSIWLYLHGVGIDCTWRQRRIFLAMVFASLYVVSMPTLFSAMTGYAAVSAPSLEMPPEGFTGGINCQVIGGCEIYPCGSRGDPGDAAAGDGLVAGWGVVIDSRRLRFESPWPISVPDAEGKSNSADAHGVAQYYERYKSHYDAFRTDPACRNISSLRDCPATNIKSVYTELGDVVAHLDPPLLDIQLWGTNATTGRPNYWLCAGRIINVHDFDTGNVTGICNAVPNVFTGTSYMWGFSFLLLFLVCVLNLVFAAIVYGLWIDARRCSLTPQRWRKKSFPNEVVQWKAVDYPSTMTSVMTIAAQARAAHGDQVFEWNSHELNKTLWRRHWKTKQKGGFGARNPGSASHAEEDT